MDRDRLTQSTDDKAARVGPEGLVSQRPDERRQFRVLESRQVAQARVRGVRSEDLAERLIEERQADEDQDHLVGLRRERAVLKIVGRTRSGKEQRVFLHVAFEPRPVVLALLGLRLPRSCPYDERLGYCGHREGPGGGGKRQDGNLYVLPSGTLPAGGLLSHRIAVEGFSGRGVRYGHRKSGSLIAAERTRYNPAKAGPPAGSTAI